MTGRNKGALRFHKSEVVATGGDRVETVLQWLRDGERVYCKEVPEILQIIRPYICITDHLSFVVVCLDPEMQQTALVAMRDVRFEYFHVPVPQRTWRLAAYRQFTWWMHTRLGCYRRVIPVCAVNLIRQEYTEESGQHTGFQMAQEDWLKLQLHSVVQNVPACTNE